MPNHYDLGYKYCSNCRVYLKTTLRSCPKCGTRMVRG